MSEMNLFQDMNAARQSEERASERQREERKTALGALSILRIVSKALEGAMGRDTITDPARTEETAKKLIDRIGTQSIALHEKLGNVEDERVLPSITGSVATLVGALYRDDAQAALSVDVADILNHARKTEGVWSKRFDDPSSAHEALRESSAIMQAMAPVLAEYLRFDMHHSRDSRLFETLGNLLWSSTNECIEGHPVSAGFSEPEKDVLRRNLLSRGGEILAHAWRLESNHARAVMNECPTEERRQYKAEGYPIDNVINIYQGTFGMLEASLYARLNQHEHNPAPSAGPGMG